MGAYGYISISRFASPGYYVCGNASEDDKESKDPVGVERSDPVIDRLINPKTPKSTNTPAEIHLIVLSGIRLLITTPTRMPMVSATIMPKVVPISTCSILPYLTARLMVAS